MPFSFLITSLLSYGLPLQYSYCPMVYFSRPVDQGCRQIDYLGRIHPSFAVMLFYNDLGQDGK